MIPLQYIGKKPEHDDTLYGTGLWGKGAIKKVDPTLASYMLFHGDVWQDARALAARKKDPIVPMKKPRSMRPDKDREHDVIHVNIANLSKEGLQALAKNTFNRDLPEGPISEMRAGIRNLMRMRP